VVRYADDALVGFEFKDDAERFWAELKERMQKFQLELHPEKTRLIEFGRHAAKNRKRVGLGKPETFDFLGFKHICGKTRKGRFMVLRQTIRKRMQATLQRVKIELRRRMHDPVPEVGKWLKSVVSGHIRYFGVPATGMHWLTSASRSVTSGTMLSNDGARRDVFSGSVCNGSSADGFLRPISAILIPRAVCASPPEARAGCGKSARPDLCGGYGVSRIPTATPLLPMPKAACSRDDSPDSKLSRATDSKATPEGRLRLVRLFGRESSPFSHLRTFH
jgi:Reverse transcriptase (RNA-dependent DNA polymerase)